MRKLYNRIVLLLAIITIIITILDLCGIIDLTKLLYLSILDNCILIFFAFDYIIRLIKSENKLAFFKNNIFDLLAIIPFNTLFSFCRIFRIFRIMRFTKLLKLFKLIRLVGFLGKLKTFLYTNGFIYVLYSNIAIIILGAVGIYSTERGTTVKSFGDALWWAFVTATTVGYGDISPHTPQGRAIATLLMIFGISLVSMLTGTIATYFNKKFYKEDANAFTASEIHEIKELLKSKTHSL